MSCVSPVNMFWMERQSQDYEKLANAAHAHVVTMDASACRFRLFDNG